MCLSGVIESVSVLRNDPLKIRLARQPVQGKAVRLLDVIQ
jgi:hypothetical protein